jgi:hypothetical protein
MAGTAEQLQAAQLGEHITRLATGPTADEQPIASVGNRQTAAAMNRAPAAPVAAFAMCIAERGRDLARGIHGAAPGPAFLGEIFGARSGFF